MRFFSLIPLLVVSYVFAAGNGAAEKAYLEANALWAQGKISEAYMEYHKALSLDAGASWSYDALERLALLSTSAPDDQLHFLGQAAMALSTGKSEEADKLLEGLVSSGRASASLRPWLALWRARSLMEQKRNNDADAVLTAEVEQNPMGTVTPRLVLERIKLKLIMGDKAGAEKILVDMQMQYPERAETMLAESLLDKKF